MMGWPAHAHTMTRAKCWRSCGVNQTLNYCRQNDSHSSVPAVSCLRKSYSLCGGDERVSNINLSVSCCLPVWCTVFRPECTYNWFCNYSVFIDFKSKRGVPNCSDTALLSNLDPRRSFISRLYHCTIYIYTVFTEQFLFCFVFGFVFNCYVWKMNAITKSFVFSLFMLKHFALFAFGWYFSSTHRAFGKLFSACMHS